MDRNRNILVATNSQKVLNFFLDHPGKEFVEKEIQRAVKISKSGTNYALRGLVQADFLFRNKKGKQNFYSLSYKNPIIKQLKVTKIIIQIQPLLESFKKLSSKVILFGNSSCGEDIVDSDVDLFIVTHNKVEIEEKFEKFRFKRKVQPIFRTQLKYTEMKQTEPVFYGQVSQGIVLWETSDES